MEDMAFAVATAVALEVVVKIAVHGVAVCDAILMRTFMATFQR